MKASRFFWFTQKEVPKEAEIASHQLMLRAGLVHKSASGLYDYLPMFHRSLDKLKSIIKEEMEKIDCHELSLTVVTDGNLWKESGRWDEMEGQMAKLKDKKDRDLCLSPTNEEAITNVFRTYVKSYKDLPLAVFQTNTKFRDEIRPRFGLMRAREFVMKDAYTFHETEESLRNSYLKMKQAYINVFKRCGLEYGIVEADAGAMGNKNSMTHEFQVIAKSGEDELIVNEKNDFHFNMEKAVTKRPESTFNKVATDLKEIETPNIESVKDLSKSLEVPLDYCLKALVYTAEIDGEEFTFVIQMLGDDFLNEIKLKNFLGAQKVFPSHRGKLKELGLDSGYIGPLSFDEDKIKVVFDDSIDLEAYYFVGSKKGTHYQGFCPKLHSKNYSVGNLRLSRSGDYVPGTTDAVKIIRGIEVGHIFELGQKYSESMNASVLAKDGKPVHPFMGCYGIGLTRTLASAVEQKHDENGIVWPVNIAPFHVYLMGIYKEESSVAYQATIDTYAALKDSGIEVFWDDRKLRPGVKFKDSDLLGLPFRVVIGERELEKSGGFEVVDRSTGEKEIVPSGEIANFLKLKMGL